MINKDIIKMEASSSKRQVINYRITEKCNYKCPYCWYPRRNPINWEGDLPVINNVFENLKYVVDYYIKQGKEINLFLTGGEPSLYPLSFYDNLFKIIVEKKIKKVTLSTNFSANPEWFIGFADQCKGKALLEIKAAFHPSGCELDDYIAKIKKVKDFCDRFVAHFTFDDHNFIGIEKINEIKDLNVDIDVVPIHSKEDADYGAFNITNPDLLSLISGMGKDKAYKVYYKDGTTGEINVNDVKKMDFSSLKPVCYNSNITILNNKIGINCEFMRSIKRINPSDWMDISVKRSKKEIFEYLQNDCSLICDKKSTGIGSNCNPSVLKFGQDNLFIKMKIVFLKFIKRS